MGRFCIFWYDFHCINSSVLLENILHKKDQRIFIVGAYRDNEVDSGHQLSIILKEYKSLYTINLKSLSLEYLNQMISDTLGQSEEQTLELSKLIHIKTSGNPFFSREFINTLYDEQLITLKEKEWIYDLEKIKKMDYSSNVIDFMVKNLKKTPKSMQLFLNRAACFGNTFKLSELQWIWNEATSIQTNLVEPLQDGWIIQIDSDQYKFFHDRLQQASYEINDPNERKEIHLVIGSTLLKKLKDLRELDSGIFDVVNHLNKAKDLFEDQITLIQLNLAASTKSFKNSAFSAALNFSQIAIDLLPENVWETHYELAFSSHSIHANSCFGSTHVSESEKLFQILIQKSKTNIEKLRVYKDYIKMAVLSNEFDRSYDILMDSFQIFKLTKEIPVNDPTALMNWVLELKKKIDYEISQIGGVKEIEKLNKCTNEETEAFCVVLSESLDTVFLCPKANPLMPITVALMSLYLHLTQGMTNNAPVSFSIAGWLICAFFIDPMGYELTKLAEKLLEQTKNPTFNEALVRFNIGVNQIFGGTLKQGLYHFNAGCNYAIAHGEYVFGCYNMNNWGMRSIFNGENLKNVVGKIENYQTFCKKINNLFVHSILESQMGFVQDILGIKKYDPKFLLEGIKDLNWSGTFLCVNEAILAFYNGDLTRSKSILDEREPRMTEIQGVCAFYCGQFFHALIYAHFYKLSRDETKLKKFDSFLEIFKGYSAISPFYFGPRYQLLCVVRETFNKDTDTLKTLNQFYQTFESCKKYGLPMISALTNELMLDFCIEKNLIPSICQYYFENLITIWENIGGTGKISKLNKKYSKFNYLSPKKHSSISSETTTSGTNSSSTSIEDSGSDSLDMMSIVKASQALSVELTSSNLIKKVLSIIKENTGAERCLLIMTKGKDFRVTASINKKGVIEELNSSMKKYDQYCAALVEISIAMKKQIILNNAKHSEYSENSYIKKNGIKSLFIHPIIKKNVIVGLIYLENKSLEGIFNNNRKIILEHIGSQLSISYENAQLYDEMNSLNKSYERFLPKEFLFQLGKGDVRNIKKGDAVVKNMCVMFSDIRNFTDLTENMNPEESFSFINGILSYLTPVISKNHGFIDKFFGDCIMALFPQDVDDSIKCGFEMLEALEIYNFECRKNKSKVSIGVGIHYGEVMVGTIGDDGRIDATVISDTVNTASRVESLTKTLGANFVVTEDLLVGSKSNFKNRFIGKYLLKGKKNSVSLFQMLNESHFVDENFNKACHLFESRKFHQARELFSKLKENDFTSKYLENVSKTYENYNFSDEWSGEIKIDKDGRIVPLNLALVVEKEIQEMSKESQMKILEKLVNQDEMKEFFKLMSLKSPEKINSLLKEFSK
jgi:predicted ATPase/class 3 adenylate cyclase